MKVRFGLAKKNSNVSMQSAVKRERLFLRTLETLPLVQFASLIQRLLGHGNSIVLFMIFRFRNRIFHILNTKNSLFFKSWVLKLINILRFVTLFLMYFYFGKNGKYVHPKRIILLMVSLLKLITVRSKRLLDILERLHDLQ